MKTKSILLMIGILVLFLTACTPNPQKSESAISTLKAGDIGILMPYILDKNQEAEFPFWLKNTSSDILNYPRDYFFPLLEEKEHYTFILKDVQINDDYGFHEDLKKYANLIILHKDGMKVLILDKDDELKLYRIRIVEPVGKLDNGISGWVSMDFVRNQ